MSKIIDRNRLDTSDSFIDQNIKLLTCRMCDQILISKFNPKACGCNQAYYCDDCLANSPNAICLECNDVKELDGLNEIHKNILDKIKVTCINRTQGCRIKILISELSMHETQQCLFKKEGKNESISCPFCTQQIKTFEERESHYCQKQIQYCHKHKDSSKITIDRISNLSEVQKLLDFVRCGLCSNLLNQPRQCCKCNQHFCQNCIVKSLLYQNYCPNCYQKEPSYTGIQRNLQNILNQFKVTCKNNSESCQMVLNYKDLEAHENNCNQCLLCKQKCQFCHEINDFSDTHKCKSQLNGTAQPQGFFDRIFSKKKIESQYVEIETAKLRSKKQIEFQKLDDTQVELQIVQEQNDRDILQIEQAGYFMRVSENIKQYYNYPTRIQVFFIILTALFDPIMQNSVMFLLIHYLSTQTFLSYRIKNSFLTFFSAYVFFTFICALVISLSIKPRREPRGAKFIQLIISIFSLQYFMFVFMPWVQNYYTYQDLFNSIKNTTAFRNLAQSAIMVTLVTVVGLNNQDNDFQWWTLGVLGSSIPFNIIECFALQFQ
ncbi:e3 ubiquitin-protein ligase nrdp1-like [Stylonychia lemnae]|uniref:E3 ubiquitin-protein ligase nrdp1-like n=1 Tax=Stylonychia lemnae TaxID=5949 RepID=A0A078AQ70_STYLE|nr:e3 ubiquitin-protein ligase nrdp1-like [Stylonychia lemnae]|eukprot:CDW84314.1 e3 ubiquitin-protein ligase nrdp1-like [Stylonychia lemnae]